MTSRRNVLKGGAAVGASAFAVPAIIGLTASPAYASAVSAGGPITIDGFTTPSVDGGIVAHLGGERLHNFGITIGGGTLSYDPTGQTIPGTVDYGDVNTIDPFNPPLNLVGCTELCLMGMTTSLSIAVRDSSGVQLTGLGGGGCAPLPDPNVIDLANVTGIRLNFGTPPAFVATSLIAQ